MKKNKNKEMKEIKLKNQKYLNELMILAIMKKKIYRR